MSRDPGALTVVLALTCPDRAGIVHIPVTQPTKDSSQAELIAVLERTGVELVILARCMQILSDWLCTYLQGRAINDNRTVVFN
jgi:formyltetrahydrofolate hydrolase